MQRSRSFVRQRVAPRRGRNSVGKGSARIKWTLAAIIVSNVILTGFFVYRSLPKRIPSTDITGKEREVPRVTVTVMNGCGVSGIAQQTRNFLADHNFSVIDYGNWQNFEVQRTVVLDRFSAHKENARKVASALGLGEDAVIAQLDPSSRAQVTVLLGRDYLRLIPFRQ